MTEIKTKPKRLSVPQAAQYNFSCTKVTDIIFNEKMIGLNKRQQNRQQARKLRAFEAACSCAQPKIRCIGQKFD